MNPRLSLMLLVLGIGSVFGGRIGQTETLTLEQCIAIALKSSPLILRSMQEHKATLARIDQATAHPYPSVDFNSDLQPVPFDFVNSEEAYLGVSQTFEFPGKRELRGRIAEEESAQSRAELDVIRLDIVFGVKEAFLGLLLAQEKSSYVERDLELSRDFETMAELKYSAGDVAKVEVLRAKLETVQAANALRVAADAERLAKARLNSVMALPQSTSMSIVGELKRPLLDLDVTRLRREAVESRPELRRISSEVERIHLRQEQTRLTKKPDFDVNLSYHYLRDLPASWSFAISVPLPFLFTQRQDAEIEESQATLGALSQTAANLRNVIALEVETAYTKATTSQKQINLYETELLPQAEEVYEMFLFSYGEGEIGGIELIEARKTLNEVRTSYADVLFEYALTLALIERAVGRAP
jgi:cobalt-zinc-cadmium efflux system outer membrane protein